MSNQYLREILSEHYRSPRNNLKPEEFSSHTHLVNRSCGDEIDVYINTDSQNLKSINYTLRACAICTAVSSILSEELKDKSIAEIQNWNIDQIEDLIGSKFSISRIKCALLPLAAVQKSLGKDVKTFD